MGAAEAFLLSGYVSCVLPHFSTVVTGGKRVPGVRYCVKGLLTLQAVCAECESRGRGLFSGQHRGKSTYYSVSKFITS